MDRKFDIHIILGEWAERHQGSHTGLSVNGDLEFDADGNVLDDSMEEMLNQLTDAIVEDPNALTEGSYFEHLQLYINHWKRLKNDTRNKLIVILMNGLRTNSEEINSHEEWALYTSYGKLYLLLIYFLIEVAEEEAMNNSSATYFSVDKHINEQSGEDINEEDLEQPAKLKKRRNATKTKKVKCDWKGNRNEDEKANRKGLWQWSEWKQKIMHIMKDLLGHWNILSLLDSKLERDAVVTCFTKSCYLILANPEVNKDEILRNDIWEILSLCVKHFDHAFTAQTSILQNLRYMDHLAEPMIDWLVLLVEKYDITSVADEVLLELSQMNFGGQDSTIVKSCSLFMIKFSDRLPKIIFKKMSVLIRHLQNESHTIRCAIIEVIGNIIGNHLMSDTSDAGRRQNDNFFDIIEERFRDINSYVRSKVLQICGYLCELKAVPIRRRQHLIDLIIGRLHDKSSIVRKKAIQNLTLFVRTHPFSKDGGELRLTFFREKLDEISNRLRIFAGGSDLVSSGKTEDREKLSSVSILEEEQDSFDKRSVLQSIENEEIESKKSSKASQQPIRDEIPALMVIEFRYYDDGKKFIEQMHYACVVCTALLSSKSKSDVVEAINFFTTMHFYKVEGAADGIRSIFHLIWSNESGDESRTIKDFVLNACKDIYFSSNPNLPEKEQTKEVVRNLVSLTFDMTLGELTSLGELIACLMKKDYFSMDVIERLWKIFSLTGIEVPKQQRHGAIIILTMMARTNPTILNNHLGSLIKIGLSELNDEDPLLAKHACLALQNLKIEGDQKLSSDHVIFEKLAFNIEKMICDEWFSVAEQAINTIYILAEEPDLVVGKIIKSMSQKLFSSSIDKGCNISEPRSSESISSFELSKLLFIASHIAIKQIVYMELIEKDLKQKRRDKPKENRDITKKANCPDKVQGNDDDLDQVVGTVEDDIADNFQFLRERELLYDSRSLLSLFSSTVSSICAHSLLYSDPILRTVAVLALCRFMCVSSEFCETHLQLLFTLLERSEDANVRSNVIIALGDLAICFNNLIDQNIGYLYKRLQDNNLSVRKNALMVLTHLILNGMIKVKGQLSEMAKCLVDENARIRDLARLFFTELALKDNAVYNNLPDIISNLSQDDTAVEEEHFRLIMSNLFSHVKKERQSENLIEKLCHRFRNTDQNRQWRDIAYCLSFLPYSTEKAVKKLIDGIVFYQDKLHDDGVFECFVSIINKAKKFQKQELKACMEEFEKKILDIHSGSLISENKENVAIENEDEGLISRSIPLTLVKNEEKKTKHVHNKPVLEEDMPELFSKMNLRKSNRTKQKKAAVLDDSSDEF